MILNCHYADDYSKAVLLVRMEYNKPLSIFKCYISFVWQALNYSCQCDPTIILYPSRTHAQSAPSKLQPTFQKFLSTVHQMPSQNKALYKQIATQFPRSRRSKAKCYGKSGHLWSNPTIKVPKLLRSGIEGLGSSPRKWVTISSIFFGSLECRLLAFFGQLGHQKIFWEGRFFLWLWGVLLMGLKSWDMCLGGEVGQYQKLSRID